MPRTAEVIYLYARARAGGGWGVRGEGGTICYAEVIEIWGHDTAGSAHKNEIRCDTTDFEAVAEAPHAGIRWHIRHTMR